MSKYLGSAFLADVRGVVLTGLSTVTNAAIAATDTVLSAFGKLQAQITGEVSRATTAEALLAPKANPSLTGTVTVNSSGSGIELGSLTAVNSPYVDFHSSGNSIDYDARIAASGGTGVVGHGDLNIQAGRLLLNGTAITNGAASALNVIDFGADPTGVADSTTAFTQAFTQAITAGLGVVCPGGTYSLSTLAFSIPQNVTLSVRGAGAGATTIKFSGVNGFDFTLGQYGGLNFQGMTLLRGATTPKYAGTALHIKAPGANASNNPCPNPIFVNDITMVGTPERFNAWNTGIDLHNTNTGYLTNIRFLADNATTPDAGKAGTAIWVHGDSSTQPSIDNHIRGLFAQGGFAGLVVTGYLQGIYLTDFTILGNSYGVYWDTTGTTYGELLGLCNGHLNSYRACLYMAEGSQSLISNILFLRFAADSGEWCAVDLHNCNNMALTALSIYGAQQGTEYGIRMNHNGAAGGLPNNITGCNIAHLANPVVLSGTIISTSVVGNVFYDVSQGVSSGSVKNVYIGNQTNGSGDALVDSFIPKTSSAVLGTGASPFNTLFAQAIALGPANATRFSSFTGDNVGNVTFNAAALIPSSPGTTYLGTGTNPFNTVFTTGVSATGTITATGSITAGNFVTAAGASYIGAMPNGSGFGGYMTTNNAGDVVLGSLKAGNTGNLLLGGNITSTQASGGLELGSFTAPNTPYIDFHSSGNNNDYDARIVASGGTTPGTGNLTVIANSLSVPTLNLSSLKMGPSGWLEAVIPATEIDAEFVSLSGRGASAGVFGTRTSDSTFTGSQGGFAIGAFALNNNATQLQTAYGAYIETRRSAGAGVTHGMEINTINHGAVVQNQPYYLGGPSMTAGLWLSAGRDDVTPNNDLSLAFGIVGGAIPGTSARFMKGVVFGSNCLVPLSGVGGVAISLPTSYAMTWYDSTVNTSDGAGRVTSFIRSDISSAAGFTVPASIIFNGTGLSIITADATGIFTAQNGQITMAGDVSLGVHNLNLGSQTNTGSTGVAMAQNVTGAGADLKRSQMVATGTAIYHQIVNDAQTATAAYLTVNRSASGGTPIVSSIDLGSQNVSIGNSTGTLTAGNFVTAANTSYICTLPAGGLLGGYMTTNAAGDVVLGSLKAGNAGSLQVGGIITTTQAGGGVELGSLSTANTPYIDFHSSGNNIDYDARILASGGSATLGQGTIDIKAGTLTVPPITSLSDNSTRAATTAFVQSLVNNGTAASYAITGNLGVTGYTPGAEVGLIGWNYASGNAEVDFFNDYTNAPRSFSWYQRTGTNTFVEPMRLSTSSGVGGLFVSGGITAGQNFVSGPNASFITTRPDGTGFGGYISTNAAGDVVLSSLKAGNPGTVSIGGGVELGSLSTPNTPYIDFHSSGSNNDFDARIIASGGTSGTSGQGSLLFATGPAGIGGDFSGGSVKTTGTTVSRTLAAKFADRLNVLDFGATGNGTTDDRAAIQAAIDAAAATGARVIFPSGNYKITGQLNIGNGNATTPSSVGGVILEGVNVPPMSSWVGGSYDTQIASQWKHARITYAGATGGTIIGINGPLMGWGVQNLWLDGANGLANAGILVTSAMYGDCRNVVIQFCTIAGIYSTTVPPISGHTLTDSYCNTYKNICIATAFVNGAKGVYLGGGANGSGVVSSNTDYNSFENLTITLPSFGTGSASRAFGLYLGPCDSNTFRNVHVYNGDMTQTYPLAYDYTQNNAWPAGNLIDNIDYGPQAGPSFGQLGPIYQIGTPDSQQRPNRIVMVNEANNAIWPTTLPNLVGPGPVAVYTNKLFSQTTALAIALYTVNAQNASLYRINYYLNVTGGNAGGGTIGAGFFWLDGSGSEAVGTAQVPNSPGNYTSGSIIAAVAGGTINMTTALNSFPGGTTTLYSLFMTIERLM